MPTIDRVGAFRVFFYSDDHEPEHVHIERDGEVKIEFFTGRNGKPNLIWNKGMKKSDVREAMKIVKKNRDKYLEDWNEFYD